jgi:hypothetical protein
VRSVGDAPYQDAGVAVLKQLVSRLNDLSRGDTDQLRSPMLFQVFRTRWRSSNRVFEQNQPPNELVALRTIEQTEPGSDPASEMVAPNHFPSYDVSLS